MSVDELIEELQRQPNRRLPVVLVVSGRRDEREYATELRVRFDGPRVLIEED